MATAARVPALLAVYAAAGGALLAALPPPASPLEVAPQLSARSAPAPAWRLAPPPTPAAPLPAPVPPRVFLVGEAVRVSGDRPDVPHVEPFLAAHPDDAETLFGAAVSFPDADPRRGIEETAVAGFRSSDGGGSWVRVRFRECLVDPWVSFGKGADLYLACLVRGGAIAVYRSTDAGRSWSSPVHPSGAAGGAGRSADHPILAVDRSAGPRGGTVYVAFARQLPPARHRRGLFGTAVTTSRDGGRTFSAPAFLRRDELNQQPFDAAVLADGSLVVLFMDYASDRQPRARSRAWAARSADGGRSFTIAALPFPLAGRRLPLPLAADRSAAHRDRLYVAAAGQQPGEDREGGPLGALAAPGQQARQDRDDGPSGALSAPGSGGLRLFRSADGGRSWTGAGIVACGPPAAGGQPAAGGSGSPRAASPAGAGASPAAGARTPAVRSQPAADGCETPAVAVGGGGVVGVAWYGIRREVRGDCFDVFFSASLDGGDTWLPAVRVTPETSCPRAGSFPRVASRWPFGGDYSGLAAGAGGRFRLFWADSRTGVYQVWTATVEVTGSP